MLRPCCYCLLYLHTCATTRAHQDYNFRLTDTLYCTVLYISPASIILRPTVHCILLEECFWRAKRAFQYFARFIAYLESRKHYGMLVPESVVLLPTNQPINQGHQPIAMDTNLNNRTILLSRNNLRNYATKRKKTICQLYLQPDSFEQPMLLHTYLLFLLQRQCSHTHCPVSCSDSRGTGCRGNCSSRSCLERC